MFDLTLSGILTRFIVLLVAVVVHEFAHAYAAFTQGDTTAYEQGKMTLDPRANVWWPGFLIGVLGGFAILGAAPVNPYRMRNPRVGMLIAVAAGPLSNLLLAGLFAIPIRFGLLQPVGDVVRGVIPSAFRVFQTMVSMNVLLFIFNLVPLSPLDGWTVVLSLLPTRQAIWWERNRQNTMNILIVLIFLGFASIYFTALYYINPMTWLVFKPADFLTKILTGYGILI